MTPSRITLIGAAGAVLLLVGLALTLFVPVSSQGNDCGTWLSPSYSEQERADLVGDAGMLGEDGPARLEAAFQACDDARASRRTLSIVLALGAVAVPVGLFVVAGRREQDEQD